MNPRLIILIVIAAGMAIYFAAVRGGTKAPALVTGTTLTAEEGKNLKDVQVTIDKLKLPGNEPPEKPELSVQVEVDRSKGKNRLYFTISEAHGYYVEQFRVHLWYVRPGDSDPENSPVNLTQFFDRFLPAKSTLRTCMELVPAELTGVGGDMGQTSNWQAEIIWYGRARAQNPDPLPPRTDTVSTCD